MEQNPMLQPVETQSTSKIRQHIAAAIISLAAFTSGSGFGWPSPVIPILQSAETPLGEDQPMTDEQVSWLGGLVCLGALAATPIFSYLANKYSRKLSANLIAIPFIIGWLLLLFANSSAMLYAGRFILGLSTGAQIVVCPLFISEISEDSVRGTLCSYVALFSCAGILYVYIIGSYFSYHVIGYLCLVNPIIYGVGLYWIPESPLYLMRQNKIMDARRALKWYRNGNTRLVEKEVSKFVASIKREELVPNNPGNMSLNEMIISRGTVRGLIIGIGLCANVQLSGVFVVLTYTVSIFTEAGTGMSPNTATILVGGLQLLGSYAATMLVDRTGRKVLLVASNICMAACLSLLGTYFYMKHLAIDMSGWGWLPVTSVSIFIAALAIGVSPVTFVVISEVFSPRARGKATTICVTLLWILMFVVGKSFTNLRGLFGVYGCFWMFSICCVAGSLFCGFYLPETKNRSLESILSELNGDTDFTKVSGSKQIYHSPGCIPEDGV